MRILGLDLSTCAGVAVVETGKKLVYSEEIQFKKAKGIERCGLIAGRVLEVAKSYKPDFVVIEGYGYANQYTLVTLVEIGTVIRYFLWQEGYEWLLVTPTTLKKFVTGKGNSPKDAMMMNILKRWGIESSTNNVADAIALAMFGLACVSNEFSLESKDTCMKVVKEQPEMMVKLARLRLSVQSTAQGV